MGNTNKKAKKQASAKNNSLSDSKPPPMPIVTSAERYSNNAETIYTTIVQTYQDQKSCPGCIYMQRNGLIHLTARMAKTGDRESLCDALDYLITRLEAFFNSQDMTHEVYYKAEDLADACTETIKLYAHLSPKSLD
jgi:hypothetical protein